MQVIFYLHEGLVMIIEKPLTTLRIYIYIYILFSEEPQNRKEQQTKMNTTEERTRKLATMSTVQILKSQPQQDKTNIAESAEKPSSISNENEEVRKNPLEAM